MAATVVPAKLKKESGNKQVRKREGQVKPKGSHLGQKLGRHWQLANSGNGLPSFVSGGQPSVRPLSVYATHRLAGNARGMLDRLIFPPFAQSRTTLWYIPRLWAGGASSMALRFHGPFHVGQFCWPDPFEELVVVVQLRSGGRIWPTAWLEGHEGHDTQFRYITCVQHAA